MQNGALNDLECYGKQLVNLDTRYNEYRIW